MDTVGKLFGIKKPDTSAADRATAEAAKAATLERSDRESDEEKQKQQASLALGARGRRGLLAFVDGNISDTLG